MTTIERKVLRMTEDDRAVALDHIRVGENGAVEMALPLQQVPDYVLAYWGLPPERF